MTLPPPEEGLVGDDAPSDGALVRSSAAVAMGTALSRITGLIRVQAMAYAIGTTLLADTYNVANNTPNIVFELILGGVLTATLVPLFVDADERHDDGATSAIFGTAMTLLIGLTVVAVVASPLIAHLFTFRAQGTDRAHAQRVATDLIRLFIPQMVFYGLTALLSAMLNARRRFLAAAYAPVLNNIVVIALFLALPHVVTGKLTLDHAVRSPALVLLLGLGTTAGIVIMGVVLLPAVTRAGIRLRYVVSFRHPAVRAMVRLSGWTIGYVIANQVALVFVLVLASSHGGVVSAYTYAYAFFQLPHGLLAVSLMTTLGPELASLARRGQTAALRARFSLGLRSLLIVIVPASIAFVVLARPIVVGLIEHGDFGRSSAAPTADALRAFSVGLVPFSVYLYALRGFYALRDTRTPFIVNCLENALNIALAALLYPHFGISGLAYAFSLAYGVSAIVALAALRPRLEGLDGARTTRTALKAAIAGAALAIATALVAHVIHNALAAMVTAGVVGIVVYLAVLQALGADELQATIAAVRRDR